MKLSKQTAVVGESIQVEAITSIPDVGVEINGVAGASQYLQFRNEGTYTVTVTAFLRKRVEQRGQQIAIRKRSEQETVLPIIWAAQDRYQPRVITFSIANATEELVGARKYVWDFGDGTQGTSEGGGISPRLL